MSKILINIFTIVVIIAINPMGALANQDILVSPNRIIFEKGADKRPKIYVSNPSDKTRRYRVSLINKIMKEDGSFKDLEKGAEGNFLNKMLRYSPRSFSLAPKTARPILLKFRKAKDLADGEYRSHILVQVIPDAKLPEANEDGKLSIAVKVNYGIAIPIIARVGSGEVTVKIDELELNKEDDKSILNATLSRIGNNSSYGDLIAIFTDYKGEEHMVKALQGIALYPELSKRNFSIPLDIPNSLKLRNGKLKLIYKHDESEDEAYDSKEIKL